MFPLVSGSIQSSVNLGNLLLRIAREWKIAETWFLARLFILQLSLISQILELIYWTITIFCFDHITDENREYVERSNSQRPNVQHNTAHSKQLRHTRIRVNKSFKYLIDSSNREFGTPVQRHAASVYRVFLQYWTSMLWSIDTCQNKVSAGQYHVTILRAQVYKSSRTSLFWSVQLTRIWFSNGSRAHVRLIC